MFPGSIVSQFHDSSAGMEQFHVSLEQIWKYEKFHVPFFGAGTFVYTNSSCVASAVME